ncbi:glycosyltransferase [Streptomyces sp. NBC_01497]|uniref:glycosyltransferase n=1 Tax=Streptomyces sp. NBC_01497 TaxID=2903885 RepID=UPI002E310FB3|nr:glycosyltransferase [Streptomyces sp. NBC_01497]
MRILFSSTPAHGHLLPQLPLARAFRDRGDAVAVMTSDAFAPVLAPEGIDLLGVGPSVDVLFAETARRTGVNAAADPTPAAVAEFFAGTRVDLTADDALAAARGFAPDLIVAEACDFVGPLAAAALDVPFATLAFGPAIPAEFTDGLAAVAASRFSDRGLAMNPARWYLDPCPDLIQAPGWTAPQGRLALRPEPHQGPGAPAASPTGVKAPGGRARVLVTFGTYFAEPQVLGPILTAVSGADIDLRVTLGLTASADDYDIDDERIDFVGFTPLAQLLDGVDLVLTHGGAGTTLAALSRGLPLVVVPQGADQFLQAAGVAASRTGVAVPPQEATPEAVARAAAEVLADPVYADNARKAADQIASMPSPAEIADRLAAALS